MLAALAQFERKLIQERVRAGLEAAWASGSVSGRKPMDHVENSPKLELAVTLVRGGKTVTEAARTAGIGRSTLYRYLECETVPQSSAPLKKGRGNSGTDLGTGFGQKSANGAAY
jgi:DNA invertase Pin-like site-specific DNA recombinase